MRYECISCQKEVPVEKVCGVFVKEEQGNCICFDCYFSKPDREESYRKKQKRRKKVQRP